MQINKIKINENWSLTRAHRRSDDVVDDFSIRFSHNFSNQFRIVAIWVKFAFIVYWYGFYKSHTGKKAKRTQKRRKKNLYLFWNMPSNNVTVFLVSISVGFPSIKRINFGLSGGFYNATEVNNPIRFFLLFSFVSSEWKQFSVYWNRHVMQFGIGMKFYRFSVFDFFFSCTKIKYS